MPGERQDLRDAEVDQLDRERVVVAAQEDVPRLDVTMDDARRVHGTESVEQLEGNLDGLQHGQCSRAVQAIYKRLTRQQLHHVVRTLDSRGHSHLEDTDHVPMVEKPRDLRFGSETLQAIEVGLKVVVKHLDGDQLTRPNTLGTPHGAHSALPQGSQRTERRSAQGIRLGRGGGLHG